MGGELPGPFSIVSFLAPFRFGPPLSSKGLNMHAHRHLFLNLDRAFQVYLCDRACLFQIGN